MKNENQVYSIQSEIELKQYDCSVTLYFTGVGWDQDIENSINHKSLEEAKSACEELKERFPDIEIQILEIKSTTETEYIDFT